ncbi:hotdog domain-containing protein [Frankia sp. Cr1]|uniref:hotdog domain-containing protein n=1 Tax=Frankia sp. Cr1 TaxID=3073931 RepID=UPI002AD1D1A6|nr:hotdog domain-containing protein [Frankia sp. Cr1]
MPTADTTVHAVDATPGGERPGGPVEVPWSVLSDYRCFGCSPHNDQGLQLQFRTHPEGLQARFTFGRAHESYPGVVHGGLVGVVCDEIMGNLIVLQAGLTAFTTAMKVRYVSPLFVGRTYDCVARMRPSRVEQTGVGLTHAAAEILDLDGATMATATASYRLVSLEEARRHLTLADTDADRLRDAMSVDVAPENTE